MKQTRPLLLFISLIVLALPGRSVLAQDGVQTAQPIRVTETLHSDGTKTIIRTDPDNHSSTSETYNKADKLLQKMIYELDDQGQATGATAYSPKGTALYKLAYKRDGANRVNEVDTYAMTGTLLTRTVYQYSATGRVIAVNSYDANGTQISTTTAPPNGVSGAPTPGQRRGVYNPNR